MVTMRTRLHTTRHGAGGPRLWARLGWIAATIAAAILLLVLPLSCTTTIVPPAQPIEPVTVYLLDYGRTPGLVLPAADGGAVEYVYGEWEWYALRRTGPLRAMAALFLPTQGALGRDALPGPATREQIMRHFAEGAQEVHPIKVAGAAAQRLRERLEVEYRQALTSEIVNESYGYTFVKHPQRYTYFSNSNHITARWLRELGCAVHGPAFHSSWRIAAPAAQARAAAPGKS